MAFVDENGDYDIDYITAQDIFNAIQSTDHIYSVIDAVIGEIVAAEKRFVKTVKNEKLFISIAKQMKRIEFREFGPEKFLPTSERAWGTEVGNIVELRAFSNFIEVDLRQDNYARGCHIKSVK